MKKGWRIILIIVAIALLLAAVCVGVGFLTGANSSRLIDGIEQFFATTYNIDFNTLINDWIPSVVGSGTAETVVEAAATA